MNKALPWNVNGVGFDARDAAREAAHRQGKSLGEWLHGVIADHAADLGVSADEMGGQQRIHAVTSKLERLSARGTDHERRPRNGRTLEGARRRASWSERDDDAEAREDIARDLPFRRRHDKPSPDTTEVLLEEAIEAMERRAVRAEQRTDNALQSFTRLLERTEAERDRERDSVAVLAKKLTDMEARLTDKLSQDGSAPAESALVEDVPERRATRSDPVRAQTDLPEAGSSPAPRRASQAADLQEPAAANVAPMRRLPRAPTLPASTVQGRAPLTRLEAKLKSMLGETGDSAGLGENTETRVAAAIPASAATPATVARAPWMVERFDVPTPETNESSAARTVVTQGLELPPKPAARAGGSLASRLIPPHAKPVPREDAPVPTPIPAGGSAPLADQSAALAAILGGNRRLGPAIAEITRRQRALDAQVPKSITSDAPIKTTTIWADAVSAEQVRLESAQFAGMQKEIAGLTSSIEGLRREVAGQRRKKSQVSAGIAKMQAGVAATADKARDLAARCALTGLETSIQSLADVVATSRAKSPQSKILPLVEALVPDLRKAAETRDVTRLLTELETSLRALAASVGGLPRDGVNVPAFTKLQMRIGELQDTIGAADQRPLAVEQIQTQIGNLIARLERLRRYPNSKQDIRGDVDALRQLMNQPHDDELARATTQIQEIDVLLTDFVQQNDDASTAGSSDLGSLEHVVRELSSKLDAVQLPGAGAEAFDALQKQIATMSDRFEQSQDGFSKLASLEQSMRQLFSHLEDTRSSVEQAAVHAAREVLRIAAQGRSVEDSNAKPSLDTFNALQDEAAARTTTALSAVHGNFDDIVSRLSSMEAGIAEVRSGPRAGVPDKDHDTSLGDPTAVGVQARAEEKIRERIFERAQQPSTEQVPAAGETGSTDTAKADDAFAATPKPSVLDQILGHRPGDDAPKGVMPSASFDKAKAAPAEAEEDSRADFIAAARRAAKVAQADLADLKRPTQAKSPKAIRAGLLEQSRDYVTRHKRPVLLSMAALFVIAGALTIIKLGAADDGESRVADVATTMKTARLDAPAQAPEADTTSAGTRSVSSAHVMTPVTGTDATPTGSVAPLPSFAAAALPRSTPPAIPAAISAALQSKANAGDSAAQYALGLQYADGTNVARNFGEAARWYQKAADQNVAPAQYRLASLYEKGLGVTQDKVKAKALYLKAAEAGNPRAMHNLAVLLADGDGKPDYDGAATWFRKAAQYGIHDSQYNLGILLARGIGVKQSLIQSYQWFAIAAAQGDNDAAKKRDEVGSKLRSNDIAVATALAGAFHPRQAEAGATEVQMPSGGWDSVQPSSPVNSPRPKISAL